MNQRTKWALLMQKKRHKKSHAWAPLSYLWKKMAFSATFISVIKENYLFMAPYVYQMARGFTVYMTLRRPIEACRRREVLAQGPPCLLLVIYDS
jgi:hypothetical protein